MKLQFKVLLWMIAIFITGGGISVYFLTTLQRDAGIKLFKDTANALSSTIENALETSMVRNDPKEIKEILGNIKREPLLQSISIYSATGNTWVSTEKEEVAKDKVLDVVESGLPAIITNSKGGREELRILSPVANRTVCQGCHKPEEKVLGVIEVHLGMKTFSDSLQQSITIMTVLSGFFFLLLLITIVIFLKKSVLDRIASLHGYVSKISEGNYEVKIEDQRSDELGNLSTAFDKMRKRIGEHTYELTSRITELTRRLNNLHIFSETISTTVDVIPGLKELGDLIKDWLHCEICNIYLLQDNVLRLQSTPDQVLFKTKINIGEGHVGSVAKEKKAAWKNDFKMKKGISGTLMAVPLISQDKLVGVIEVWRPQNFSDSDFSLLSIISSQVATAVENRQLFKELRSKKDLLHMLFERITSAQEEERKRIAIELHDEIGQILNLMMIHLDSLDEIVPEDLESLKRKVGDLKSLTTKTLDDIHNLIYRLRPTLLDDLGLIPAIRWYAKNYLESTGIKVRMNFVDLRKRLPSHVEVGLFRIIQEAFANILRHAKAENVTLYMKVKNTTISVLILDDGNGFNINRVLKPPYKVTALGLQGIEERVSLLRGHLQITSQKGEGTRLFIKFPLIEEVNE
jgi:signal transduction histidine kinase